MADSLKQKTVSGVIWSVLQKFGVTGISFLSNIVLARLLSPDDFGCIGMLMVFIAIANTFVDGGFGSALIQKKSPTDEDYSTIFYWNLLLSVVLYTILYFAAPLIARYYKISLLTKVLRVQGLVLFLNSISIIQQNKLRKELQFKKLTVATITSSIISLIVTIVLAWKGFGVWALVVQQLLMSGLNALLLWNVSDWRPIKVFSKTSFKQLFNFGSFILLSNLINTICNNVQSLIIGRFCNTTQLGYYSQASKLEMVSSTSISSIVDQVSYPVLSKVQGDKERICGVTQQFLTSIAFVSFPLLMILCVVAEPLITLLYSAKWLMSVPYFQILCVAGCAICIQNVSYYAVAAVGNSKQLFLWTIVKRGLGLVTIIIGFIINGIIGLLWGVVASAWILTFINAIVASKYTGYKFVQQVKDLFPIVLITAVSFMGSFICSKIFFFNSYIVAMIQIAVFSIVYLLLSLLFRVRALGNLSYVLNQIVKKE